MRFKSVAAFLARFRRSWFEAKNEALTTAQAVEQLEAKYRKSRIYDWTHTPVGYYTAEDVDKLLKADRMTDSGFAFTMGVENALADLANKDLSQFSSVESRFSDSDLDRIAKEKGWSPLFLKLVLIHTVDKNP